MSTRVAPAGGPRNNVEEDHLVLEDLDDNGGDLEGGALGEGAAAAGVSAAAGSARGGASGASGSDSEDNMGGVDPANMKNRDNDSHADFTWSPPTPGSRRASAAELSGFLTSREELLHTEEFAHEMIGAVHKKNVRQSRSFIARSRDSRKRGTGFGKRSQWDLHVERLNGILSNDQVETLSNEELWKKAIEGRWKQQRGETDKPPSRESGGAGASLRGGGGANNGEKGTPSASIDTRRSSTAMTPFVHPRRAKRTSMSKKPSSRNNEDSLEGRVGRLSLRRSSNSAAGSGQVRKRSVVQRSRSKAQQMSSEMQALALLIKKDKCRVWKTLFRRLIEWRIYPHTTLHSIWAVFTIFFVLWTGLTLPVTVAIIPSVARPEWWKTIDIMADYFFIIDVLLNFRSVYLDTWGAMVIDPRRIAHHYMFGDSGTSVGWFWIDAPAAIPWTLFPIAIRGIRDPAYLFNLPKLLRVFQLPEQIDQLPCIPKDSSNNSRITRLFGLFVIVAHWFGCLWYWVGTSELCRDPCRETSGGDANGHCSWVEANDYEHLPANQLYVKSLYWAITTMTSVGYGDISPINMAETLTAAVIMLIGSAMYATIFSNMASYIQSIDADVADFQQKMRDIRQQMKYLRIPKDLRGHIEMYYNYMWTCHKGLVEHKQYFYKDLPPALNLEISMHLFRETVGGVKLFAGCSDAFLREVVLNLEPQVCIPGEYIVNKNDVARAMFFITRGEVEVLDGFDGKHLAFLNAPQYFGETAILEARRRTASIQALTYADLYFLMAANMQVILKSFGEDDERIHQNALNFLNHGQTAKEGAHRSTYQFMKKGDMQRKRERLQARINKTHRENVANSGGGTETKEKEVPSKKTDVKRAGASVSTPAL